MTRKLSFAMHPDLLSRQLGSDMYRAPEALRQLIANALDADATRVNVEIEFNDLETPSLLRVRDNGCGISPQEMKASFGDIGVHQTRASAHRQVIGSRGIGRFSVFSLGVEARWQSISSSPSGVVKQT